MNLAQINWIPLLVASVASMAVGFIWYSNALFGKQWMRLSGITQKDMKARKSEMPKVYITMFVASLVSAYVLSQLIGLVGATNYMTGVQIGFWAWLGFVAPVALGAVLFEGKKFGWYVITVGYQLASLVVMGGILAVWK